MKKTILTTVVSCLLATIAFAQAPQTFSYQTVVRDNNWQILANQNIGVQVAIIEDVASGTIVYEEEHTATTNDIGLINLAIGGGSISQGAFGNIDWGQHDYYMKISVDISGGTTYTAMGTTQLRSVPYALFAETANNAGPQGIQGIAGTNGTNGTNGVDGIDGNDGAVGATGAQGIQGLPGDTGVAGINGVNGTNGIDGADGIDGATGAQGIQGIQGLPGDTGATGLIGLTGAQGIQGIQGVAGTNGTNGVDGIDGATGATGAQGIQGIAGVDGNDGAVGATGLTGAAGTNGVDGAVGPQGAIGLTGNTGATGSQGIQGTDGADGVDGATGLQGVPGNDGAIGLTGATGLQGVPGNDGIGIAQTLNINGDTLFISDGNYVLLNSSSNAIPNISMDSIQYDNTGIVTFNAEVLPSGGGTIIDKGFCWSTTNPNPTIYDEYETVSTGTGSYSHTYLPDTDSVTYYVRGYATNTAGINYSDVFSFSTNLVLGMNYAGGIVFSLDGSGNGKVFDSTVLNSSFSGAQSYAANSNLNGYSDWSVASCIEYDLIHQINSLGSNYYWTNQPTWNGGANWCVTCSCQLYNSGNQSFHIIRSF